MTTCPESYVNEDRDVFASPTASRQLNEMHVSKELSYNNSVATPQAENPVDIPNGQDIALRRTLEVNSLNMQKKFELVKTWSLNTFKCTKQVIEEKLGTTLPTTDEKLDLRIECLRQMQKQYRVLLDRVRTFTLHFAKTVESQRQLAFQLAYMSQQQLELAAEFNYNAATQRIVADNGEKIIGALKTFCDAVHTLVEHTFTDTLLTIKQMNSARVEYDVYRKDAEAARARLLTSNTNDSSPGRRAEAARARFEACHQTFTQIKSAVDTKLRLLHENRVRVMQNQLLLLHNATSAYFSGNNEKLEQTLDEYNVKFRSRHTAGTSSWLEKPSLCSTTEATSSGATVSHNGSDTASSKSTAT